MTINKASAQLRQRQDGQDPSNVASLQPEEEKATLQHPPSTVRTENLYQTTTKIVHGFMDSKSNPKNSAGALSLPATMVMVFVFYVNHAILLALFFFISIYKNLQCTYRRIVLKFLTLAYYPNKSPQLIREDVNKLTKIPRRVSCILDLKDDDEENGGVDGLISNISELAAWSLGAGIPNLGVYEYTGIVGRHLPELIRYIKKNLSVYFGTDSVPIFSIRVPHSNSIIYSTNPSNDVNIVKPENVDLEISLLSRIDGKPTIVELTKIMCELAVSKELSVKDITVNLVNDELTELVGPEPDLLIYFGPSLDLQDYPPWQIRLTEIYWEPENRDVNYAVFVRALQKFSNCKVNVGK
ncbi:uncharacterized protein PRCAT00005377001 [Priceomyces carsonii]|uniref:uncharacterized protein n=1 Tax=Priceomyces carsonii TaxID=28549 RepID=UPI002ED85D23|nr:unnamed protein product [Priceomyces carsonii]